MVDKVISVMAPVTCNGFVKGLIYEWRHHKNSLWIIRLRNGFERVETLEALQGKCTSAHLRRKPIKGFDQFQNDCRMATWIVEGKATEGRRGEG